MKNIIPKEIIKKIYSYFSWGYCYFGVGYFLSKKIYMISLNNEFKNKTMMMAYAYL